MLKQLVIISGISSLSGCAAMSGSGNCDPKFNYVKSNIPAMEEYSKLKKEGKIDSIYYEYLGDYNCKGNDCVLFDQDIYKYYETNYSYNDKKGVYTLNKSDNFDNKNCIKTPVYNTCLLISKNTNNEIKSRYKLKLDSRDMSKMVISFIDLKNNIVLYEKSYQVYSTGGLGGPGGSYCPPVYIENPNYEFDAGSFSNHGILTKTK